MALTACKQATGAGWVQSNVGDSGSRTTSKRHRFGLLFKHEGFDKVSLRRIARPLQISTNQKYKYCSTHWGSITTSMRTGDSESFWANESTLIIVRHGESMWNENNLFTGCVDVSLTRKGVEEAIEAGKRICTIPFDIVYTSALVCSQMTAMLALIQHCCQKVPIFIHNENEEAKIWNRIYSEDTNNQSIPAVKACQ